MTPHKAAQSITTLCVLGSILTAGSLAAQSRAGTVPTQGLERHEQVIKSAEEVEWQDGPESLPPGSEFAVLEGDPTAEGVFTMRLKFPDGYRIPPHTHPKVERVTVVSGTMRLGMEEEWDDEAMQELPEGSFFAMPPGMVHFAAADGELVLQLTGLGPWEIDYINPSDDPRRQYGGRESDS